MPYWCQNLGYSPTMIQIRPRTALLLVLPLLAALIAPSAHAQQTKLTYAGFLEDAQVLTLRLDMAGADKSSYYMSVGGELIGLLANMYPFHMALSSQGRLAGQGADPSRFSSDINMPDGDRAVTLTYSAGGNIQMTDNPSTAEGQQAFARGLVRGTIDPLSAVAAIAHRIGNGQGCSGNVPVFDGVRRFNLALMPLPASAVPPHNLRVNLANPPRGCDAALTLLSGFPQSAIDSGMYPKTARFWFTSELNSPWPVLLRIDADSGLGHIRMDFVSAN